MTTATEIEPYDLDADIPSMVTKSPIQEKIEIALTEWKSRTIIRRSEVQDVLLDLWNLAAVEDIDLSELEEPVTS